MKSYYIGVDCGTQSTKAVVMDGQTGAILGSASETYDLIPGLPAGHKEQHPETWIKAVKHCVQKAVKLSHVDRNKIKGIGISGQQHGFVALDKDDRVIRPAKLWCDTSTISQCHTITRKVGGEDKVIQLTGNTISAGFTAPKILWLKEKEPKNFGHLACVMLPHDYINFWLTGEKIMEPGDASGTAMFDVKKRSWSDKVVRVVDSRLSTKLPPVAKTYQSIATLRPGVAKELGLSPDVQVSPGGGDNMMGAIGTGNVEPGMVTASLGTSGTIYAYSPKPMVDPRGEIAGFCDSTGHWLPLLCTLSVTVSTELAKKAFQLGNDALTKTVARVPAGAGGLLLLPYFEGERTPNLPEATGVYFGLREKTFQPAVMARAAMEGATLGMNYGLNRMKALGIRPRQIRLIGGGSKNPVWRQMAADIFNVEVVSMVQAEGAAFGGALQAQWCCEKTSLPALCQRFVQTDSRTKCVPDKKKAALYQELQHIHNALSASLKPAFHLHRRFLEKHG